MSQNKQTKEEKALIETLAMLPGLMTEFTSCKSTLDNMGKDHPDKDFFNSIKMDLNKVIQNEDDKGIPAIISKLRHYGNTSKG